MAPVLKKDAPRLSPFFSATLQARAALAPLPRLELLHRVRVLLLILLVPVDADNGGRIGTWDVLLASH